MGGEGGADNALTARRNPTRMTPTTRERLDRLLIWAACGALTLVGVGLSAWAAVVWKRSDTLIQGQQQVLVMQARIEGSVEALRRDIAYVRQTLNEHRQLYAHDGAREALNAARTALVRLEDKVGHIEDDAQRRADLMMHRLSQIEDALRDEDE